MPYISDFFVVLYSHVCHQSPDRSFSFLVIGEKSILCARCTGMYLGLLCGALQGFYGRRISNSFIIKMLIISLVFIVLDKLLERYFIFDLGKGTRAMTGIIFGISVGIGTITPIKKFGGFK